MTTEQIRRIAAEVRYNDWDFHVGAMGDGSFLQVRFTAPDSVTGQPAVQHGRKWYVSSHAVADEVVKTAWLAVLTAVEHETREAFRYEGQPIFHPHTDVEALAALQRTVEPAARPHPNGKAQP